MSVERLTPFPTRLCDTRTAKFVWVRHALRMTTERISRGNFGRRGIHRNGVSRILLGAAVPIASCVIPLSATGTASASALGTVTCGQRKAGRGCLQGVWVNSARSGLGIHMADRRSHRAEVNQTD